MSQTFDLYTVIYHNHISCRPPCSCEYRSSYWPNDIRTYVAP